MKRYPYHRYLTYQVLNGDAPEEIVEHMRQLEYIPPSIEDVGELRDRLMRRLVTLETRKQYGVDFFDVGCKSMNRAFWIVETPIVRTCVERLLLDKIHPKNVAIIAGLKFDHRLTIRTVELFRDGFWDTSLLSVYDFGEYFHLGHRRKPDPPPDSVSLTTRPAYSAWKNGLQPDEDELSPDTMVREIQVDAFMRFKETRDPKTAKGWAELVLKTAPARRALVEANMGKRAENFLGVKPMLEYPEYDVPTLGELHSEYSENMSGTGAESENMGRRQLPRPKGRGL